MGSPRWLMASMMRCRHRNAVFRFTPTSRAIDRALGGASHSSSATICSTTHSSSLVPSSSVPAVTDRRCSG